MFLKGWSKIEIHPLSSEASVSSSKPARVSFASSGEFDSHTLPPASRSFAPLRVSPADSRSPALRDRSRPHIGSTSKPARLDPSTSLRLALVSSTLTRFRQFVFNRRLVWINEVKPVHLFETERHSKEFFDRLRSRIQGRRIVCHMRT
jgi:hypothetical protein